MREFLPKIIGIICIFVSIWMYDHDYINWWMIILGIYGAFLVVN